MDMDISSLRANIDQLLAKLEKYEPRSMHTAEAMAVLEAPESRTNRSQSTTLAAPVSVLEHSKLRFKQALGWTSKAAGSGYLAQRAWSTYCLNVCGSSKPWRMRWAMLSNDEH